VRAGLAIPCWWSPTGRRASSAPSKNASRARRVSAAWPGFGEKPILKLMFGALTRAAERWRGLRFTEFELRQIAAVRKDLDAEYDAKLTPPARSSHPRFSSKSAPFTDACVPRAKMGCKVLKARQR
jgi:hypothetical protein